MRTKSVLNGTLIFVVIAWVVLLHPGERRTHHLASAEPSGRPGAYVEPFGVPLAPPVWFVNFLLLYFSTPDTAIYLPAYRVPLPHQVYACLRENPDGCPYAEMERYFREQAGQRGGAGNKNSPWPSSCQTDPQWAARAPREYRHPDQINEPLGSKKAAQLARLLGIRQDMILTDDEYQCLIGSPPRDEARQLIFACFIELTNSKGNSPVPLSSYGLSLNEDGGVRSLCAAGAVCLEANEVFAGPLQAIALECGFAEKLQRLFTETPIVRFMKQGHDCQTTWQPACIAESSCPGNGGQSSNSCEAPAAPR